MIFDEKYLGTREDDDTASRACAWACRVTGGMAWPVACTWVAAPASCPGKRRVGRPRPLPRARATRGEDETASTNGRSSSSSWKDVERFGRAGEDYLFALGDRSASVSTEVGARNGMIDDVFAGTANTKFNLGADSDLASGELRYRPTVRQLKNIKIDGHHVPPRFLDKVALHIAKNALADANGPWKGGHVPLVCEVPLILGIWGPKGCGKSFNVELCLRALGANCVVMSAGELEDQLAGVPGRTIRERYVTASQTSANSGALTCLVINDVDAGAGFFKNTQNTVNSQMVIGTLMNICDHPDRVSVGGTGDYAQNENPLRRVPIIVTGNDLSTLYAPLLRDGRMDKFCWAPNRDEICEVVFATFTECGLSRTDAVTLVDHFPLQKSVDFFGAIHAKTVDDAVLRWTKTFTGTNCENDSLRSRDSRKRTQNVSLTEALFANPRRRQTLPGFSGEETTGQDADSRKVTLAKLIKLGDEIALEQTHVNNNRLVEAYMPGVAGDAFKNENVKVTSIENRQKGEARRRRQTATAETTFLASVAYRRIAEEAREALEKANAENPTELITMLSPAERAERVNKRLAERTAADNRNAGGWTVMDGGVTSEKSVTESRAYDAFDDMDWG